MENKCRKQAVLEESLKDLKMTLDLLRTQFDQYDANHPLEQNAVAQKITSVTEKIEWIEKLLNLMNEDIKKEE